MTPDTDEKLLARVRHRIDKGRRLPEATYRLQFHAGFTFRDACAIVPYLRVYEGRVTLMFSPEAEAVLRADSTDQIYYTVRDSAGRVVAGDPLLPRPPNPVGDAPVFWDDEHRGAPIRAVALATTVEGQPVQVFAAETRTKRARASRDAMLSAPTPDHYLPLLYVLALKRDGDKISFPVSGFKAIMLLV